MVCTVLLDLDGVVRHFDPAHMAGVERRHGLAAGALASAAFDADILGALTTGRLTRAAWTAEVGRRVDNAAASAEWLADRGRVDEAMIAEVDRLRRGGTVVAVLTNGSDTIAEEMAGFGLDRRFDAIFNTAEIGFAKPDRRAFEHVCVELGVEPGQVFFTDDTMRNVTGAIDVGMNARHFVDLAGFRRDLADLGLGPAGAPGNPDGEQAPDPPPPIGSVEI